MYIYRDKVAAHPAITDPFGDDSIGTLERSAMNSISYHKPYFIAGGFMRVSNGQESVLPKMVFTKGL